MSGYYDVRVAESMPIARPAHVTPEVKVAGCHGHIDTRVALVNPRRVSWPARLNVKGR